VLPEIRLIAVGALNKGPAVTKLSVFQYDLTPLGGAGIALACGSPTWVAY